MVAALLAPYLIIIGIQVREEQEREKEILLKIQSIDAEALLRNIHANGEVIIQDGKVVINDLEFNEISLVISTCYYNESTGSAITPEQLIEQFYAYIINYEFDESTEELEDFCAFAEEEGTYRGGGSADYERYDVRIFLLLNEQGLDKWTATQEQLEEACKKAFEELFF